MRPFDGRAVLLVVSGGIAAYKAVYLCRELRRCGAAVDVILTQAGEGFVGGVTFEAITGRRVHRDVWEEPLAHLDLGREADVAVVAPATADLLARMANGLASDMATATLLAAACPVLVCPAMNVRMWEHPATRANVERLRSYGVRMLGPEHGELAEGEIGLGRMAEPEVIRAEVGRLLESGSALTGRRVIVTAGPTRAPIDPVRFISNRSSGRMGFALAASAWRRGANVALITGPATIAAPHGPRLIEVEDAEEMLAALEGEIDVGAVLIMNAAVGDFRPAEPPGSKIKREATNDLSLRLRAEIDLLAETRARRQELGVFTVGFALETDHAIDNATRKLAKGIELMVLNQVGPETGFDALTNRVTVLTGSGEVEEWPLLPKPEVAERLLDRIETLLTD